MLKRFAAFSVLAVLLPLLGCSSQPESQPSERIASVAARSGSPIVIAISMDGLNPSAISRLGKAAPHFRRLMRQGSWTLNARTATELTDTLPNHTGMMTGRRIDGRHGHHVRFNNDRPESWLAKVAGHYVRGMFDVAHDRGVSTALYTSKSKFDFLNRSWGGTHGAPDRVGADNGRDKIGTYVRTDPDRLLTRMLAQLVRRPARMTFWHNSVPDAAGHAHGFMSKRYLDAVRHTDAMLGRLLATLDRHPALKARVRVILTADHGGYGASHRDPTKLYNFRVPFMVWGRGVAAGRDLYSLNPSRLRPHNSRPDYVGIQPIRNLDVGNLATASLGLPAVFDVSTRRALRVR